MFRKNLYLLNLEGVNSPNKSSLKIIFGGVLKNYFSLKIDLR